MYISCFEKNTASLIYEIVIDGIPLSHCETSDVPWCAFCKLRSCKRIIKHALAAKQTIHTITNVRIKQMC